LSTSLRRRLAAAVGAGTAALAFTGCAGVFATSDELSQVDQIGDARITSTLCLGVEAMGMGIGMGPIPIVTRGGDAPEEPCVEYEGFTPSEEDELRSRAAAAPRPAERRTIRAAGPTHADVVNGLLNTGVSQVLLSYKVPATAEAPASITGDIAIDEDFKRDAQFVTDVALWPLAWNSPGDIPDAPEVEYPTSLTFTEAPSYAAELGDAGEGMKWVGYVSEQVPLAFAGDLTINADFGAVAGAFPHVTNVGARLALSPADLETLALTADVYDIEFITWILGELLSDEPELFARGLEAIEDEEPETFRDYLETVLGPNRPVDCDEELDLPLVGGGFSTSCSMDPAEGIDVSGTLGVRDVGITGGSATAEPGDNAAVPFELKATGPAATQSLSLSAGTNLPFSTATARTASWTPAANETRTELVDVPVPADARPGVYNVEFAAEVGGEIRRAVARLTVGAPVQQQESRTPQLERLYIGRKGTVAFGYICPAQLGKACANAEATLWANLPAAGARAAAKTKAVKIVSKTFRAKAGKRVRVTVKVGPKMKRRIVKLGRRATGSLVVKAGTNRQNRSILLRRG
jgi:hypothetical protein